MHFFSLLCYGKTMDPFVCFSYDVPAYFEEWLWENIVGKKLLTKVLSRDRITKSLRKRAITSQDVAAHAS